MVQELVSLSHGVSMIPAMARRLDQSDRRGLSLVHRPKTDAHGSRRMESLPLSKPPAQGLSRAAAGLKGVSERSRDLHSESSHGRTSTHECHPSATAAELKRGILDDLVARYRSECLPEGEIDRLVNEPDGAIGEKHLYSSWMPAAGRHGDTVPGDVCFAAVPTWRHDVVVSESSLCCLPTTSGPS